MSILTEAHGNDKHGTKKKIINSPIVYLSDEEHDIDDDIFSPDSILHKLKKANESTFDSERQMDDVVSKFSASPYHIRSKKV